MPTTLAPDGGFETPALAAGSYQSAPTGTPWIFAAGANNDCGISANADTFQGGAGAGPAPEGSQCAYLIRDAILAQDLTLAAGTYTFSFKAAQRRPDLNNESQTIRFMIAGVAQPSFTPTVGGGWQSYTSPQVTLPAGTTEIFFQGHRDDGTVPDGAALIDAVTINQISAAPTTLIAGTITPGTATGTAVPLTLGGTSGGTTPYSIQFQQAPDVSGQPGTWANLGNAGTATTTTAAGLTPSTSYWFRAVVTGSGSPPQTATSAAVTKTTTALVLPTLGAISITSADSNDTISYPAPTAGTYPIAAIRVYVGTTAGGESATALASNGPNDPRTFTNTSGSLFYTIRVYDTAGNVSVVSNEVEGGAGPSGPVTLSQEQTLLSNLATVLLANIGMLLDAKLAAALGGLNSDGIAAIQSMAAGLALAAASPPPANTTKPAFDPVSAWANLLYGQFFQQVTETVTNPIRDALVSAPLGAGTFGSTLTTAATQATNAATQSTTAATNALDAKTAALAAEAAAGTAAIDPNLATDLQTIRAKTDKLLVDAATGGVILAPAGLELVAVEPGVNVRQALAPILASTTGPVTGAGATGNGTALVSAPQAGALPGVQRITADMLNGTRSNVHVTFPAPLPLPQHDATT